MNGTFDPFSDQKFVDEKKGKKRTSPHFDDFLFATDGSSNKQKAACKQAEEREKGGSKKVVEFLPTATPRAQINHCSSAVE